MKLGGEDVVAPDGRRERCGIIRLGGHQVMVAWGHVVGVHEVNGRRLGQASQRRRRLHETQLVPAHVRDLDARQPRETHDLAGKEVQAAVLAVLVAGREQELQAQADAEEWLALADVFADRRRQVRLARDRVDAGVGPGQRGVGGRLDLGGRIVGGQGRLLCATGSLSIPLPGTTGRAGV